MWVNRGVSILEPRIVLLVYNRLALWPSQMRVHHL
jgi:hypothetical protein